MRQQVEKVALAARQAKDEVSRQGTPQPTGSG